MEWVAEAVKWAKAQWEPLKPHGKRVALFMALSAALSAAGMFVFLAFIYSHAMDALEQRLKLRDDQIADWQQRLESKTPEDALIKLKGLQAAIQALKESFAAANTPQVIMTDPVWVPPSEGFWWMYERTVHVSSPTVREGLTIKAKASSIGGIKDMEIRPVADANPKIRFLGAVDGYHSFYIQHPFGAYQVRVWVKEQRDVDFKAEF